MRRWIVRAFIGLSISIALIAIAAHLILRSDLPRRIVVDQLQQQTGLRIEARELRTGWTGRTTVRDLVIALPLEDDPFLRVPEIRVRHTALVPMILGRSIDLADLSIRDPELTLRTDAGGQWNFVEAAERIAAAQARLAPDLTPPTELPRVRMTGAVVDIEAPDGRMIQYGPVVMEGDPYGAFAWRFSAAFQPHMRMEGRLSPTAPWAHEVTFDFAEIHRPIEPWLPDAPDELRLAGRWIGQIRDQSLDGRLELHDLRAKPISAHGMMNVRIVGFDVTVEPIDLMARIDGTPITGVRLIGGRLRADTYLLRAERLVATVDDVLAQIDARWDIDEESGIAAVEWTSDGGTWGVEQTGRMTGSITRTALGRFDAAAAVDVSGRWNDVQFTTDMEVTASGEHWRKLRGSALVNQLRAHEPRGSLELDGTIADVRLDWPLIVLHDLQLPSGAPRDAQPHVARGQARINSESGEWSATLTTRRWQPPGRWEGAAIPAMDIDFVGNGDFTHAVAQSLTLRTGEVEIEGEGSLMFDTLALDWRSDVRSAPVRLPGDIDLGAINAEVRIDGVLAPLQLRVVGNLDAERAVYQQHVFDTLALEYQGQVTAERIDLKLDDFDLFGGRWTAVGSVDPATMIASIDLTGEDVRVEALAELIEVSIDVRGIAGATLSGQIPLRNPLAGDLTGSWTLREFTAVKLHEISGEGMMHLRDETLALFDMQLRDGGGNGDGIMTGNMTMDFNRPDRLHADIKLRNWPLAHEPTAMLAVIHGSADVEIDMDAIEGFGRLDLEINLDHEQQPLGRIELNADLSGRRLLVNRMHGSALDAEISGAGEIALDAANWQDSRMDLYWNNLDLSSLSRFGDVLEPLRGVTSGQLTVMRDQRPRAIEPMRVEIEGVIKNGSYREITFGRLGGNDESGEFSPDFEAALNFSTSRIVLNRAALSAMRGDVAINGRVTRHEGIPFAHINVTMNEIDLEQLVHAAGITTEPTPGRVSGSGAIGGYIHETPRLYGQAKLHLTQSDLVALPGFSQLFNALRLDIGTPDPTGIGDATVRLEGRSLEISRLAYFNRGTDILARLRVIDIAEGQDSPVTGLAAGVVRPLADITIPFLDLLDRLIEAAQSDAASIRISGTVREPVTEVIPFREFTGAIDRLLGGRVE